MPTGVMRPARAVRSKTFALPIPPAKRGAAVAMPSGTLCTARARATAVPRPGLALKPAPMAKPSGKLCRAIPKKIKYPTLSRLASPPASAFPSPMWMWGTRVSRPNIRPAPIKKPAMALTMPPRARASGSRLKADIASIAPEAKPRTRDRTFLAGLPRRKTRIAPRAVAIPANALISTISMLSPAVMLCRGSRPPGFNPL